MTKVPSPNCWRRLYWCRCDEGCTFSRMLEKVMLLSPRLMMMVPSPYCWRRLWWFRLGRWWRYLHQTVGESDVDVAEVDDKGSFSISLEKVMLMSPRSTTKVPSPDYWRRWCWCRLCWWRRFLNLLIAEVDDEGTFSRMSEKVRWCRWESMTKVP